MIKPLCQTADSETIQKRGDDVKLWHREEFNKIQTWETLQRKPLFIQEQQQKTSKLYRREKKREKKIREYWKISATDEKVFKDVSIQW